MPGPQPPQRRPKAKKPLTDAQRRALNEENIARRAAALAKQAVEKTEAECIVLDPLDAAESAFVDHFIRYRNRIQAYKASHDYPAGTTATNLAKRADTVLQRPHVLHELNRRQQIATEASLVDVQWIFQRLIDVATADPRELIGLKIGCCRYCHGAGHLYQWREREYMEAMDDAERASRNDSNVRFPDIGGGFDFDATRAPHPDCPDCHGEGVQRIVPCDTDELSDQAALLYGGVKAKRDGYEIIIADRDKALELAGKVLGAFTDKVQISGQMQQLIAIADLRESDPEKAAADYTDFVAGRLTVAS